MKWSYKDCDVEVTTAFDPPSMLITPIIEIDCKKSFGRVTTITTSMTSRTTQLAEECGQDMARDWIEKNLGKRPWAGLKL